MVDLETHTVIDVLDEHTTEAVEKWLREHPEVHTICRDRNGRYAKAARKAAPGAKQVADRFHLVQNLRDNIQRELSLHQAYLRVQSPVAVAVGAASSTAATSATIKLPAVAPAKARERRLLPARRLVLEAEMARQRRQNKEALFGRFKALQGNWSGDQRDFAPTGAEPGVQDRKMIFVMRLGFAGYRRCVPRYLETGR